ncbi:MAG TPA: PE family protein, partial [Mycobacterium sp.]|nr:PE family protein [Mycobacterium sp.]
IINGLTSVASTDIATALPTADLALALGVSLPNYDASLFVDGLEAGNLLAAIGNPIAADVGILPLPIGLEAAVIGEAFATTAYDLLGGLIP